MTRWKTFDVNVRREVHLGELAWPDPHELDRVGWLSGNKIYYNLSGMPWTEVERVLDLEAELLERMADAADPAAEEGIAGDEMYEEGNLLHGLDIGVASAVVALSAAGCVPFSSCNGGVFGRSHQEDFPLVAFYARKITVPLLLECAQEANAGLINSDEGELVLHGQTIEGFRRFAETLVANAPRFDA